MKRVLVLGATGLVGKNLVALLAGDKRVEQVIAITRRPVSYDSEKIGNVVVDFERLDKHKDVFTGDALFSCLGTTLKQAGSVQAQRKVDLDYQLHAARLAADNGVAHYLLVSSSGANHKSKSPYLQMKGELQQRVNELAFARTSIFQPSLLLGERESFRLAENIGAAILPTLCKLPGLQRYRPISGEDVARKMLNVATSDGDAKVLYRLEQVHP